MRTKPATHSQRSTALRCCSCCFCRLPAAPQLLARSCPRSSCRCVWLHHCCRPMRRLGPGWEGWGRAALHSKQAGTPDSTSQERHKHSCHEGSFSYVHVHCNAMAPLARRCIAVFMLDALSSISGFQHLAAALRKCRPLATGQSCTAPWRLWPRLGALCCAGHGWGRCPGRLCCGRWVRGHRSRAKSRVLQPQLAAQSKLRQQEQAAAAASHSAQTATVCWIMLSFCRKHQLAATAASSSCYTLHRQFIWCPAVHVALLS
jgi:hypothetical protein